MLILFTLLIVFAVYHIIQQLPSIPQINDIWVINLDKDTERWDNIQKHTRNLNIRRWPAIYGKEQTHQSLHDKGVGFAMMQGGDRQSSQVNSPGVIGCWTSHVQLLKHLANLDVPDSTGHLITEDDVDFPLDLLQPGARWDQLRHHIPTDWDVVYVGITTPVGTKIHPNIYKAHKPDYTKPHSESGNWGAYSYMVRHGALRSKILPQLEWMTDALDEQYKENFSKWNVYLIEPNLITLNEALNEKSSIQVNKK